MKKSKIKNRKIEHRNTFLFRFSLIIGPLLIIGSLTASYFLFVARKPYVTPLPKVLATETASNTQFVDPKQAIQQALYKAKQPYDSIKEVDPSTYDITIDKDEVVTITPDKNIDQQITSLQRITSQLTMEGKRFSHLDLRYDKPVIVF